MNELLEALEKYRKLEISKEELLILSGQDLKSLKVDKPIEICSSDVINLLEKYICGDISTRNLLEWVNIIWFTDLFVYCDSQNECIASVMNELEEADEDISVLSSKRLMRYIEALKCNYSI